MYWLNGRYDEDDCRWSEYHNAWVHEDDAIYVEDCSDYFHYDRGRRRDAIRIGRRDYVLLEDCDVVDCFEPSSLDEGIMEISDVHTFECYKTPDGDLLPVEDADIVEVFVIDGEVMGQID